MTCTQHLLCEGSRGESQGTLLTSETAASDLALTLLSANKGDVQACYINMSLAQESIIFSLSQAVQTSHPTMRRNNNSRAKQ